MVTRYKLKTFTIQETPSVGETITDAMAAARVLRAVFATLDSNVEHFVVLTLNTRGKANGWKVVGQGTAAACLVHPREVFRAAIELGAASVIVAHNHPSGDATPSEEDKVLTRRLQSAGDILGIPMVDHLVLTHNGCVSVGE